jgi:hypothetical protein
MRLPRPGENLYLRLRTEEVETWKKIVEDPGLPFNCTILVDADVRPGHAYVEVSGARIDVGKEARLALITNALGLDGNPKKATRSLLENSGNLPEEKFSENTHLEMDQSQHSPDSGEVETE